MRTIHFFYFYINSYNTFIHYQLIVMSLLQWSTELLKGLKKGFQTMSMHTTIIQLYISFKR